MSELTPVQEFGLECLKARKAVKLSRDKAVTRINDLARKRSVITEVKTLQRVEKGENWPKFAVVIAMAEVYEAPWLITKRVDLERQDFSGKKKNHQRGNAGGMRKFLHCHCTIVDDGGQ